MGEGRVSCLGGCGTSFHRNVYHLSAEKETNNPYPVPVITP